MVEGSRLDVEELISYSGVLVELLSEDKDVNSLKQCLEQSKALQCQCHDDLKQAQSNIQEYQKKIDMCNHKIAEAKSEVATDTEMDLLQKELEDELQRERVLREELRLVFDQFSATLIANEIDDLECQRGSFEERRQTLKKLDQDELRTQMKLSMYASVTSIIPNLDDQSKISGHIVEKDKKEVEKFEFDPVKMTAFDTCNSIWKMINL